MEYNLVSLKLKVMVSGFSLAGNYVLIGSQKISRTGVNNLTKVSCLYPQHDYSRTMALLLHAK